MRYRNFVTILGHPCDSFIHHIQCSVAFLIPNASHLQQNIFTSRRHYGVCGKRWKNWIVSRNRFNLIYFCMPIRGTTSVSTNTPPTPEFYWIFINKSTERIMVELCFDWESRLNSYVSARRMRSDGRHMQFFSSENTYTGSFSHIHTHTHTHEHTATTFIRYDMQTITTKTNYSESDSIQYTMETLTHRHHKNTATICPQHLRRTDIHTSAIHTNTHIREVTTTIQKKDEKKKLFRSFYDTIFFFLAKNSVYCLRPLLLLYFDDETECSSSHHNAAQEKRYYSLPENDGRFVPFVSPLKPSLPVFDEQCSAIFEWNEMHKPTYLRSPETPRSHTKE